MTGTRALRDEPGGGEVPPTPTRRRSWPTGVAGDVLVVLLVFAVLGVLCGVLWWVLVDPAQFTKRPSGGTMGEIELGKRFDTDGWYTVLAVVPGFLAGLLLTWWRDRDFRLTTVLLVPGAAVAAVLMAVVGRLLGPGDPDIALEAAKLGARVPVELAVTADAVYLTWPIAVLLGSLVVLWSSPEDPPGRS